MRSGHTLAIDIDGLLSEQRGFGPPRSDWSSVARLLEPLRADATPDEIAGEEQAIIAIAALIRAHPVTSLSSLANLRAPANHGARSLTEKIAVSLIAAALAGTTSLVVVGALPHSAGRAASGLPATIGAHGPTGISEAAGATRSPGPVIARGSGERLTVSVVPKPTPSKGSSVGKGSGKSRAVKTGPHGQGSGSGQGEGRTQGGDRGQGKDRGKGNDDRLVSDKGHRKGNSSQSKGGHHK
jgi:hypothetical protein